MSNREADNSHPQEAVEQPQGSIFNKKIGRRGALGAIATAGAGLVGMALVGCGDNGTSSSETPSSGITSSETPGKILEEREFGIGEAKIELKDLPGGVDELSIGNAFPRELIIRKGSILTAKGVVAGEDGSRHIAIAVTDPNRVGKDGTPRSFNGILADKLQHDQGKEGDMSFEKLVDANGGKYSDTNEKSHLDLKVAGKGFLPMLSADSAAEVQKDSGIFFMDRDPLKKDHPLLENPLIPAPDVSIMPENGTFSKESDGRVILKNANGEAVARARYYPWKKEWQWVRDPESVSDYTIREYADAKGFTFGVFDGDLRAKMSRLEEADFIDLVEKTGNQLVTGALDARTIYKGFTPAKWREIVANWDAILVDLKDGKVPYDDLHSWDQSKKIMDFARNHGMDIRAQYLLWGPETPQSISSGGFSKDELAKILEFMVKARVNKYKGSVKEWTVVGEAAPHILANDSTSFWYANLGETVIDKVAQWTHEADPDKELSAVEDHVIEGTMGNSIDFFKKTSNKTFDMLKHYKQAGVPITKFGVENNLWIYRAPTRDQMVAALRRIQDLGFKIASAEANIGTDKREGFYPELTTQNPVADPSAVQANVYADLVSAYIEVGGDFALGGLTDTTNWVAAINPESKGTIFDGNKKPKAAYFAIRDVIKKSLLSG